MASRKPTAKVKLTPTQVNQIINTGQKYKKDNTALTQQVARLTAENRRLQSQISGPVGVAPATDEPDQRANGLEPAVAETGSLLFHDGTGNGFVLEVSAGVIGNYELALNECLTALKSDKVKNFIKSIYGSNVNKSGITYKEGRAVYTYQTAGPQAYSLEPFALDMDFVTTF